MGFLFQNFALRENKTVKENLSLIKKSSRTKAVSYTQLDVYKRQVPEGLTVHRLVPLYKDWNEVLQHQAEIADGKYIREAIYGLKEPPQEETVEIIRMSEVDTQTVEWLWEPYIPFGKVTIVQGNPGEGKTTFALRPVSYTHLNRPCGSL